MVYKQEQIALQLLILLILQDVKPQRVLIHITNTGQGILMKESHFLNVRMQVETFVSMSCGSHWLTVVFLLNAKSWCFKNSTSHPLLTANSSSLWTSSIALRWTAVLVTWRCCDHWCSIYKASCSSMSESFIFHPAPGRCCCLFGRSKSWSLNFLQQRTYFSSTSYFLQLPCHCWFQQTAQSPACRIYTVILCCFD